MLPYDSRLKPLGRKLRNEMTDSERKLWSRVRRKQLCGISFYRQKPIGNYVVDFYAPKAALVVEVDGSQHFADDHQDKDKERDRYLREKGLEVLRFDNLEVLQETDAVIEVLFDSLRKKLVLGNPP
jgi:very-short-patch-repair endonuclease